MLNWLNQGGFFYQVNNQVSINKKALFYVCMRLWCYKRFIFIGYASMKLSGIKIASIHMQKVIFRN